MNWIYKSKHIGYNNNNSDPNINLNCWYWKNKQTNGVNADMYGQVTALDEKNVEYKINIC